MLPERLEYIKNHILGKAVYYTEYDPGAKYCYKVDQTAGNDMKWLIDELQNLRAGLKSTKSARLAEIQNRLRDRKTVDVAYIKYNPNAQFSFDVDKTAIDDMLWLIYAVERLNRVAD